MVHLCDVRNNLLEIELGTILAKYDNVKIKLIVLSLV